MQMLATPRLRLRARTLDDVDAILAMDADTEVRRFMGGPPHAQAHRAEVCANIVDGQPTHRRWAIEWRDRPGFLGQCGLSAFVAFIHADNGASQRVADKVGLRPAGETVLHGYRHLVYRLDYGPPPPYLRGRFYKDFPWPRPKSP
jgi:RimJ/RimL family protein N-acetyltransferase